MTVFFFFQKHEYVDILPVMITSMTDAADGNEYGNKIVKCEIFCLKGGTDGERVVSLCLCKFIYVYTGITYAVIL